MIAHLDIEPTVTDVKAILDAVKPVADSTYQSLFDITYQILDSYTSDVLSHLPYIPTE